jgi:uncharacterized protein YcfL
MKKLSFLFVAVALVALFSMNSCKSSTQPTTDQTTVVEDTAAAAVDTAAAAADTAVAE